MIFLFSAIAILYVISISAAGYGVQGEPVTPSPGAVKQPTPIDMGTPEHGVGSPSASVVPISFHPVVGPAPSLPIAPRPISSPKTYIPVPVVPIASRMAQRGVKITQTQTALIQQRIVGCQVAMQKVSEVGGSIADLANGPCAGV
jgi:hypothetical protein